jgi:methylthioribose-1-phosphate isomerase
VKTPLRHAGRPFLVRPENVVRYQDGIVRILDRRDYPFKVEFVECVTVEDVAVAIREMVTQSLGPGPTAGYGIAQAAREAQSQSASAQKEHISRAAQILVATRPTNDNIRLMVSRVAEAAVAAIDQERSAEEAALLEMADYWVDLREQLQAIGSAGAQFIEDGDVILTHCWADALIIEIFVQALEAGKTFEVVCTETRPYLQGSRLTADAVAELGIRTTVITDGMPATLMAGGRASKFIAGADRITMDGHWVNKVGTLAIALAARHYGLPAYGVGFHPDPGAPTGSDVEVEERDGNEVLHCLGSRTATPRAHGWYPAFDITPPDLVTAFVTDRGAFAPRDMRRYFDS